MKKDQTKVRQEKGFKKRGGSIPKVKAVGGSPKSSRGFTVPVRNAGKGEGRKFRELGPLERQAVEGTGEKLGFTPRPCAKKGPRVGLKRAWRGGTKEAGTSGLKSVTKWGKEFEKRSRSLSTKTQNKGDRSLNQWPIKKPELPEVEKK